MSTMTNEFKVRVAKALVQSNEVYKGEFKTVAELDKIPAYEGDYADVYETNTRWVFINGAWTNTGDVIPTNPAYIEADDISVSTKPNTLVQRDEQGHAYFADPNAPEQGATKGYTDKADKVLADAINQEVAIRQQDVSDIHQALNAEVERATNKENALETSVQELNTDIEAEVIRAQQAENALSEETATKLDKAGGTISGSLIIVNDLTVQGKTTSVDTQSLKVADKLIYVARDNATVLTSPAGLITPKYDGTNNGGIVYDSTGTAYVGDIALDSNGNVDVNSSDLQPIATRNAIITDGNIVKWNNTNLTLVDTGINADNVAKKTELDNKVDKVTGKGLSSNDFTDAEKTKLAEIESKAQVNVIETIEAGNNITVSKSDKKVTISATSGVDVEQTTGQSETAVMSQKAVTKELNDLWARIDYVAPTISTFTITPSTSSYKLPATLTLTAITHMETNVSNIVGNLTLKRGSTILTSSITPSLTSATVTISDTVTLTTSGVTYTLSGTGKNGETFSKTVSVSAYYTSYFGASEDNTVSDTLIAGLTDTNSASLAGTRTVTITNTSKYVWFISTRAISSIKSSGFEVPFTLVNGSYSYSGASYKCYRTTEKVVVGDNTFVIV